MRGFKLNVTIAIVMNLLFFVVFIISGRYVNSLTIGQLFLRVITKLVLTNGFFIVIYDRMKKYDGLIPSILFITTSSIIFPIILYIIFSGNVEGTRLMLGFLIVSALFPLATIIIIIRYNITNILPEEIGKPLLILAVITLIVDSTFLLVFFSPIVMVFTGSFLLLFIAAPLPIMISKIYFLYKFHQLENKPKRATLNYKEPYNQNK